MIVFLESRERMPEDVKDLAACDHTLDERNECQGGFSGKHVYFVSASHAACTSLRRDDGVGRWLWINQTISAIRPRPADTPSVKCTK